MTLQTDAEIRRATVMAILMQCVNVMQAASKVLTHGDKATGATFKEYDNFEALLRANITLDRFVMDAAEFRHREAEFIALLQAEIAQHEDRGGDPDEQPDLYRGVTDQNSAEYEQAIAEGRPTPGQILRAE